MKFLLTLCLLISSFISFAHPSSASHFYKFRVYLSDKGNTGYSLDEPSRFLSRQSLERKERQGVAVDESDLPISRDYYSLVEQAGGEVVAYSKWFSTLVVQMSDSLGISRIETLPFVDSVKYVWRGVDRLHREEQGQGLKKKIILFLWWTPVMASRMPNFNCITRTCLPMLDSVGKALGWESSTQGLLTLM